MFNMSDIRALEWIKEHRGEIEFRNGYIRFNDDGTIDTDMSCEFQDYVSVKVGFESKVAKTIYAATKELQKWYYGSKWDGELIEEEPSLEI
nr:hypothetical protein [Mycobacterium sp. E3298]